MTGAGDDGSGVGDDAFGVGDDAFVAAGDGPGAVRDGFVLRRAGPADVDDIMRLETSTFGHDAWSRGMMLSDLGQEHCYYLIAVAPFTAGETAADASDLRPGDSAGRPFAGHPIAGYAGLLSPRGASDADIQTIAVAPDARRQGLGRTLMLALISEARSRGAKRVFLEVRADNPSAQHLYDTLGFLPVGVRRGYYQPDNVDAIVMRLDLAPDTATTRGAGLTLNGNPS